MKKSDNSQVQADNKDFPNLQHLNKIVLETPQGILVGKAQTIGEVEINSFKDEFIKSSFKAYKNSSSILK